jgi:predicted phage terminase large subunit-like protein
VDARTKAVVSKFVLANPFIPHRPTPHQVKFLADEGLESLYGGAAGGGKSDALLASAAMFVDVPGYAALVLRKSYADLTLPGALIDRSHEWWDGTDAAWSEQTHSWTFPSGATVTFGYLDTVRDRYRYQSAEFQFIGFDELTQFPEVDYRYLFSRLRRLSDSTVPVRMRAASNPGGIGHDWVKVRFLDEPDDDRTFYPAKLADNPHVDRVEYMKALERLDPFTRQQLVDGDWDAAPDGELFLREWFRIVDAAPLPAVARYWDLAATEVKAGRDPDWTVGAAGVLVNGDLYVTDLVALRASPATVEARLTEAAQFDGRSVVVHIEQEPGSSGKALIDHYARGPLLGFAVHPHRSTGSKVERARPLSSAAEGGRVFLVRGAWVREFIDEAATFPSGAHDDRVDAVSGLYNVLSLGMAGSAGSAGVKRDAMGSAGSAGRAGYGSTR